MTRQPIQRLMPGVRELIVLLDIRQPFAYLALRPAFDFAKRSEVAIDFLPITDSPLKEPSQPTRGDDRGTRHRRIRAQAIAREIDTYAKVQGLHLTNYYRDPDPSLFNRAWLWMREHRAESLYAFLESSFQRYWDSKLDLTEPNQIAALLGETKGDRSGDAFMSWNDTHGRLEADELEAEIEDRGLARAPTYLVENEVFVGRQHLPMIEWILDGRAGPGPI